MHPWISGIYIYEITSWPGQNVPGGVFLYISHIGMCCPKGMVLRRFGLTSGTVFERITAVYERIYRFNLK